MSGFTIGWLIWIGYFVALEGWTLFNSRSGDTLSEHVWAWFGTQRTVLPAGEVPKDRTGWTQLRRFVLLAFMAWLGVHFITGGWV